MALGRIESRRSRIGRCRTVAAVAIAIIVGSATSGRAQEPTPGAPPGSEPAPGGFRPRIVREGTVSLGAQAQYGTLVGNVGFGRDFKAGPGMVISVRYRTSRDAAVGLSFGAQRFNVDKSSPAADVYDWARGITTTFDYYQYFDVRKRTPRYFTVGAGLAQMRRRLLDGETDFPGDAGILTLGGGTEIWCKRWLTIDLSVRYYGLLGRIDGGSTSLSHNIQAAAGLQFYTSR